MRTERIVLNTERNVTLTGYILDTHGEFSVAPKRPAVIILPGGGYGMCSDREADPAAFAYLKAGYHAFVLRYSVKAHKAWPNPLNDYEQAFELITGKAEEWGIYPDKIAVLGFSAGGHLAACAATVSKYRPAVAILGYAALDKATMDMCKMPAPVPIDEVTANTCPCFLFSSREDGMVPIKQHIEFEAALIKYNISFESHIYAYAPHGYSTGESYLTPGKICSRAKNWVQDSIEWLKDMFGDFENDTMTEPEGKPRLNDDLMDFLSLECTLGYLKAQNDEVQKLLQPLFAALDAILKPFEGKDISIPWQRIKGAELCQMAKLPEAWVKQTNVELKKLKR